MIEESEWAHVQRVMGRLRVDTVVIAGAEGGDERIYVNGELVYSGPDSAESRGYWGAKPFIHCNADEDEWQCTHRDGTYLDIDLIQEDYI
jgi:hypothetical protein